MKRLLVPFIFFSQLAGILYSQEENKLPATDTIKTENINELFNLFYKLDEFEFYKDLTEQKKAFIINPDAAKLWLEASMSLSNNLSFGKEKDITPGYLHSSLYDQYLENSKFNLVRSALGIIQAGAAGYLAYNHIKKWAKDKE